VYIFLRGNGISMNMTPTTMKQVAVEDKRAPLSETRNAQMRSDFFCFVRFTCKPLAALCLQNGPLPLKAAASQMSSWLGRELSRLAPAK
jgi:hypothetical protein